MATRILSSLARYAAEPWQGWIGWEQTLASGVCEPSPGGGSDHPASSLARWVIAARSGERPTFQALAQKIRARVSDFSPALLDFERAWASVDASRPDAHMPDVMRFRSGASAELPLGMSGFASLDDGEAIACVVCSPNSETGVRILRVGARLIEPDHASEAKQPRTQALIAVLALAGESGLPEGEAFARAYGFAFNPELHRDAFNVTVHRARAHVQTFGVLDRAHGQISLRVTRPKALTDPRCVQLLTERVLRSVAVSGKACARDIARDVGVSLRSAQNALEALVDDGGCERRKLGRNVEYVLEDTTFQEPTRHRLKRG